MHGYASTHNHKCECIFIYIYMHIIFLKSHLDSKYEYMKTGIRRAHVVCISLIFYWAAEHPRRCFDAAEGIKHREIQVAADGGRVKKSIESSRWNQHTLRSAVFFLSLLEIWWVFSFFFSLLLIVDFGRYFLRFLCEKTAWVRNDNDFLIISPKNPLVFSMIPGFPQEIHRNP